MKRLLIVAVALLAVGCADRSQYYECRACGNVYRGYEDAAECHNSYVGLVYWDERREVPPTNVGGKK